MIHLITTKKTTQTEKITVLDDITKVINILSNETELCLDTETSGLNPLKDIVKMLQIGTLKGDQYIIDTRDFNLDLLKPLLENPKILYIGHNIKFDYNMLKQYDIVLNNVYDTMIVDQVIYNGRYSIKEISESKRFSLFGVYKHYFNKEIKKDTRNEFIYIGNKDYTEDQIIYGAMDVVYPIEIKNKQEELIELYNLKNVINLENRFTLVLGDMEYNGFKIDINKLKTVIKETIKNREISIKELDEYLISKAPNYRKQGTQLSLFGDHDTRLTHVNWSSDQQVYDILTKVFNINAVDKYGKNSAGKDALEQLDEEYYDPIISKLLKYRQQEKIITSFGEEYIHKYIDKDNRIHTSFNQIVSTGRISSRNPNLQQIPRTKEYRSCFISDNDYLLSCADYSNQESRIMADFSNDESYIQYFKDGNDPHSFVATKMFSASFKKEFIVTSTNENKEYRQKGKTLNFGISFGMSAFTLSKRLHISDKEAQQLIDLFYSNFPKLETLFASARQFGIDNGYIRTNSIINRIRWFPEWNDLNKYKNDRSKYAKIKGSIERKSQNTIIQGSASDMTKIALIKLRDVLLSDGIRPLQNASVKLISVVHDETIIEAKKDIIEYYSNIQKECMEKAGEVICKKVKIKAEPMITPFWKH